jgi:hypothetical protein
VLRCVVDSFSELWWTLVSKKCEEFLYQLRSSQIFKRESAPCSYLQLMKITEARFLKQRPNVLVSVYHSVLCKGHQGRSVSKRDWLCMCFYKCSHRCPYFDPISHNGRDVPGEVLDTWPPIPQNNPGLLLEIHSSWYSEAFCVQQSLKTPPFNLYAYMT